VNDAAPNGAPLRYRIWSGLALADATRDGRYREQATLTARAVDAQLSDARDCLSVR
jgi:hypothetical protein